MKQDELLKPAGKLLIVAENATQGSTPLSVC
jgi:hypothetical protein